MRIRAFFVRTLVNAELDFEHLTSEEQIEMINKLIQDHNISYPDDKKQLVIITHQDNDKSLDW